MKYIRQIDSGVKIQTMQDVCIVCGEYMPEGAGMVCQCCVAVASASWGEKAVQVGK